MPCKTVTMKSSVEYNTVVSDECASTPCLYGGTCVDGDNGFTCKCPAGLTGTDCSVREDVCDSKPCGNTGICFDGLLNNPVCVCNHGYEAGTAFLYICWCQASMQDHIFASYKLWIDMHINCRTPVNKCIIA